MKKKYLKKISLIIICVLIIPILIFVISLPSLVRLTYHTWYYDRIPNLRHVDWQYHDLFIQDYVSSAVKKYGAKNLIAFVGDSILFQDAIRSQARFPNQLEILLNLKNPNRYHVLNLGTIGTSEQYLYEIFKICLQYKLEHLYAFVPLRDYYHAYGYKNIEEYTIENARLMRYQATHPNDLTYEAIEKKMGTHISRFFSSFFPWAIGMKYIASELFSSWPRWSDPRKTVSAVTSTKIKTTPSLETGKIYFVPPYPKEEVDEIGKLVIETNPYIASLLGVANDLKKYHDKITFVLSPSNEKLEKPALTHGKKLAHYVKNTIAISLRSDGFRVLDELIFLSEDKFRSADPYHFNFWGSWTLAKYIRENDPFFLKTAMAFYPIGFRNLPKESSLQWTEVAKDQSSIRYNPDSSSFTFQSATGEPAYLSTSLDRDLLISGTVLRPSSAQNHPLEIQLRSCDYGNIEGRIPLAEKDTQFLVSYLQKKLTIQLGQKTIPFESSSSHFCTVVVGFPKRSTTFSVDGDISLEIAWNLEAPFQEGNVLSSR